MSRERFGEVRKQEGQIRLSNCDELQYGNKVQFVWRRKKPWPGKLEARVGTRFEKQWALSTPRQASAKVLSLRVNVA